MRLWIDTDLQPDDLLALRCAHREPGVEVVGVSRTGEAPDAVALAAAETLLVLGPLTNVAGFLDGRVLPRRVVVMGGAVDPVEYRGRTRTVETNLATDPAAAAAVLGAVRVLLVPLDVTAAARLPAAVEHELVSADSELRHAVERWRAELRDDGTPDDELGIGLHDPLALLVALDAVAVHIERICLTVDADGRLRRDPTAREHDVVRGLDTEHAIARIVTLLRDARH